MLQTARKLFDLLDSRERLRLGLLFAAMLGMAFLQMASIAAVLPFLSVAANPDAVHSNAWLAWVYELFGFTSTNRFLVGLGVMALIALILSNAWIAATQWAQIRFVRGRTHGLSMKLMRHYLAQPYVWFLKRNSADLGKNILAEVNEVTAIMMACLQLAARMIVAVAILGLLIALDPLLAVSVAIILGGAYGGIYLAARQTLSRLGAIRVAANTERFKAAGEAFGAIKDVKLFGKEEPFLARFRKPSERVNRTLAFAQTVKQLPHYALETLAFGGVLIIAIMLLLRGGGMQDVIPVLGLYVFAGYRLMPSLQQIFQSATSLRFGSAALGNLHRELAGDGRAVGQRQGVAAPAPICLRDRLELANVTFTYPGAERPALQDISLTIRANTTLGIRGPTGGGKTTLVDVILGLLRPQDGAIEIDGTKLTDDNLRAWQAGLGYVAQHIYLSDDSIAANIAFGVPASLVDMAAVERAARLAQIHDFVAGELAEGYSTVVGERGVRLSGGQRQRIGIARALYHDPALLVFDEATSALDTDTEAAVMEAIERLSHTRTIIVVAHRLTTLEGCDEVVRVEDGRLAVSAAGASTAPPVIPAKAGIQKSAPRTSMRSS